jgi:hypothetical protein
MTEHMTTFARTVRATALLVFAAASAALTACASDDGGGSPPTPDPALLGPQQVDPGTSIWRKVVLSFDGGTPLATVYVFNQDLGTYVAGVEYWYVNQDAASLIGSGVSLEASAIDESGYRPPPDPRYFHEQRFRLDENASWGSGWNVDPVSGGSRYTGADVNGNFVGLRLFTSGSSISRIVWYQEGSPTCSVCVTNITPNGTFTPGSGPVVPIAGYAGYDVDQSTIN